MNEKIQKLYDEIEAELDFKKTVYLVNEKDENETQEAEIETLTERGYWIVRDLYEKLGELLRENKIIE